MRRVTHWASYNNHWDSYNKTMIFKHLFVFNTHPISVIKKTILIQYLFLFLFLSFYHITYLSYLIYDLSLTSRYFYLTLSLIVPHVSKTLFELIELILLKVKYMPSIAKRIFHYYWNLKPKYCFFFLLRNPSIVKTWFILHCTIHEIYVSVIQFFIWVL